MSIFESLENLNVSEECFQSIIALIEARMEDSPIWKVCNGEPYPTEEESVAYTNQLEKDKKEYKRKESALKRKLNKKPKPIPPHKVPGQLGLFEAWEVEDTGFGRYKVWKPETGDVIKHIFRSREHAQEVCNDYNKNEEEFRKKNS